MALDDISPLELLAERTRLQHTFSEVGVQITAIERALKQAERVSSGLAAYAADTRAESDIADIASLQTLMEQETGVPIIKSRLLRQLITMEPRVYFGRVDFKPDDQDDIMAVYVGTGWLFHHAAGQKLVYDWRTPICKLYYQFEPGRAQYVAPMGVIPGDMPTKRTYEVHRSTLLDIADAGVRANDDILKDLLERSTDGQMRTIVQTIQCEQDEVIRDEEHRVLVVQGAAGSGKTSVALHRVAYVLYSERDVTESSSVLMLSPNPVFKDYISTVLPQLGEENMEELTFAELASSVFPSGLSVEDHASHIEYCLEHPSVSAGDPRSLSISFKSSREIIPALTRYAEHLTTASVDFPDFVFDDGSAKRAKFSGDSLRKAYEELPGQSIQSRVNRARRTAARWVAGHIARERDTEVDVRERLSNDGWVSFYTVYRDARNVPPQLREAATRFLDSLSEWGLFSLTDAYLGFHDTNQAWAPGCTVTAEAIRSGKLFYEDLAPYTLLGLMLMGAPEHVARMRHVVIDEMQDYTPAEYEVLKTLFPSARFTVLGDVSQAINPVSGVTDTQAILDSFGHDAHYVELKRSYRSTVEIMEFAAGVLAGAHRHDRSPEAAVESISRHGEKTLVAAAKSPGDVPSVVAALVDEATAQGARSVGLI